MTEIPPQQQHDSCTRRLLYVQHLVIPTEWNLSDTCTNYLRWILAVGATFKGASLDRETNSVEFGEEIRLSPLFGISKSSSWTVNEMIDYDDSCLERRYLIDYFYGKNRVTPCGIKGYDGKNIANIAACDEQEGKLSLWRTVLSKYGKEYSALLLNPPGPLDQLPGSKDYFAGKVLLNSKELKKRFPKFNWSKFGHDFVTLGSYETQYHFDHLGKILKCLVRVILMHAVII